MRSSKLYASCLCRELKETIENKADELLEVKSNVQDLDLNMHSLLKRNRMLLLKHAKLDEEIVELQARLDAED